MYKQLDTEIFEYDECVCLCIRICHHYHLARLPDCYASVNTVRRAVCTAHPLFHIYIRCRTQHSYRLILKIHFMILVFYDRTTKRVPQQVLNKILPRKTPIFFFQLICAFLFYKNKTELFISQNERGIKSKKKKIRKKTLIKWKFKYKKIKETCIQIYRKFAYES